VFSPRPAWAKKPEKQTKAKRARGVAQVFNLQYHQKKTKIRTLKPEYLG
jgi:hypothetical protein